MSARGSTTSISTGTERVRSVPAPAPAPAPYTDEEPSSPSFTQTSSTSTGRRRSLSGGSTSSASASTTDRERYYSRRQHAYEDDIEPSDSASRPRHPRRPASEQRPANVRHKSRAPILREEDERGEDRRPRSHSHRSYSHRRHDYPEYYGEFSHREHHLAVPSDDDASVAYTDTYPPGHGPYDLPLPPANNHHHHHHHPRHSTQWQPGYGEYPPSMISPHRQYSPPVPHDALMHLRHHDPFDYPPSNNPFYSGGHAMHSKPFAPTHQNIPSAPSADDYFIGAHGAPHRSRDRRPMRTARPISFAGPSALPMSPDNALAHYFPPPYAIHPNELEGYLAYKHGLHESRAASRGSAKHSESPKETSKEVVQVEEKIDTTARVFQLIQEHEDRKAALEEKKAAAAAAAAAEEARVKAEKEKESNLIKSILEKFEEDRIAREKEVVAKAEAEKAETAAKAAREAEIVAAAQAAKDAAEKEAADKAKAAAEAAQAAADEAEKKLKEAADEAEKKLKEAKEAAEAHEKEKKALEEQLAKAAPAPDSDKAPIHFVDAFGRRFDFPWGYAKTWKGMDSLIKQAFQGIEDVDVQIMDGRYDLIAPGGTHILPKVWESMVQPDMEVKMEFWQLEPDPVPEPVVVPGPPPTKKPSKKDKTTRTKKTSPRATHAVPVAPLPPPPPPVPGNAQILAAEDEVVVLDVGAPNPPKPRTKKKQAALPPLMGWMLGGQTVKRSGKEVEKPGTALTHYLGSNGAGVSVNRQLLEHAARSSAASHHHGRVRPHNTAQEIQVGCSVM